jgi:hypothetical protein
LGSKKTDFRGSEASQIPQNLGKIQWPGTISKKNDGLFDVTRIKKDGFEKKPKGFWQKGISWLTCQIFYFFYELFPFFFTENQQKTV